ncbi:hypothetical protein LJC41_00345 [Desulfosarcina sp. OttesenSCG-928-G17]|nr:hypothetical protein [Desulfosarcina sp. OttesenSCG-928-G17]
MSDAEKDAPHIIRAGEELFRFAIDRTDMRIILDTPPIDEPQKRATLEYEIQILRIISVGWAIAFFVEEPGLRVRFGHHFWEQIRRFSETLSLSASLTTDATIDYFNIIQNRLDYYVHALEADEPAKQPVMVMGPAFAGICGEPNDARAILAGGKMFAHVMNAVQEYLPSVAASER